MAGETVARGNDEATGMQIQCIYIIIYLLQYLTSTFGVHEHG